MANSTPAAPSASSPQPTPVEKLAKGFSIGSDRLYGLDSEREKVQQAIEHNFPDNQKKYELSDVTIDRVNNRLGLSQPKLSDSLPSLASLRDNSKHPTDLAFHAFLTERDADVVASQAEQDLGERKMKTFDQRQNTEDRIRRASKQGIDFTAAQQGTVHFLLGGIDSMSDIVNKRNYNAEPHKDYTAAELRHVHRNWGALQSKVVFYDGNLAQTTAPWQSEPQVWSRLGPEPQPKILHTWPNDAQHSPRSPFDLSPMPSPFDTPRSGTPTNDHHSLQSSPQGSPARSRSNSPMPSLAMPPRPNTQIPYPGSGRSSPESASPLPRSSSPILSRPHHELG